MNEPHNVVISIGSNTEDKAQKVKDAINWLKEDISELKSSCIYETEAEGKCFGGNPYMNSVVSGKYFGDVNVLERLLKEYEITCGRDLEKRKSGIVPIDIDIVIVDNTTLRTRDFNSLYFKKGYKEIIEM